MKMLFKTHDVADNNFAGSVRLESTITISGSLLQEVLRKYFEFYELYVVMAETRS